MTAVSARLTAWVLSAMALGALVIIWMRATTWSGWALSALVTILLPAAILFILTDVRQRSQFLKHR